MIFNKGGAKKPSPKQAAAAARAKGSDPAKRHGHDAGKAGHHHPVALTPAAMASLPPVKGPMSVLLPGSHHLLNSRLVRIEKEGREIIVTAPRHSGEEVMADPGDGLLLMWTSTKGLHRVATEFVAAREDHGEPTWRLEFEGPMATRERRRFPRVHLSGRFQIRCGDKKVSAYLVDVSEGGMQCVVSDAKPILANHGKFEAPLILSDEISKSKIRLDIKGVVTWKSFSGSNTHLGVAFEHMPHKEVEKVRHFLQVMLRRGAPVPAGRYGAGKSSGAVTGPRAAVTRSR